MKNYCKTFLLIFILSSFTCFAIHAAEKEKKIPSKKATKENKGGKTQAYMGDPAQKRGYELGLDLGLKAGKVDKREGKKSSPSAHEDFKNASKKYRSEYGNQSRFLAGYNAGFNKGYTSGFSKGKMDPKELKSKETKKEKTKENNPQVLKNSPSTSDVEKKSSPKKIIRDKNFNPAEDAL